MRCKIPTNLKWIDMPVVSVKTFKDLILLCKIAAADVFVMNDDNLACKKARIIPCRNFSSLFKQVYCF